MTHRRPLAGIRREYGELSLDENNISSSPIQQFKRWFTDILNKELNDPTAMVLSTVDQHGRPDSRVVLLKGIESGQFVFYTNYHSTKAQQINAMPFVALNFYWPCMTRQVRIRGRIKRVSEAQSNAYFAARPRASQLSATVSPQSREIKDRAELERSLNELISSHQQALVMRPVHWGGYAVMPDEYEFWQGRNSRLHDRIHYYREGGRWHHRRLAP